MPSVTWKPWGPMFHGHGSPRELLGVDRSDGVDTSWDGLVTLGPEITTVAVSNTTVGGETVADLSDIDYILSGGVDYAYGARGTKPLKFRLTDLTSMDWGKAALAEAITKVLYTKSPGGTEEMSLFMLATAYQVISAIGATDTAAANTAAKIIRVAKEAADRGVVGLLGQKAFQNYLSSTVTMAAPNWLTRAEYSSANIVPTGLGFDGRAIVWGTDRGPLSLSTDVWEFNPTLGALQASNSDNARAMTSIPSMGTFIPLETVTGHLDGGVATGDVGPTSFPMNRGPILGRFTGIGWDGRWAVGSYYNPFSGRYYLLKWRPRQPDDNHGRPFSFYCIADLGTTACKVVSHAGYRGGQTLPIWLLGSSDNISYFKAGRTTRWPDDTSYLFNDQASLPLEVGAAGQNVYLSECVFEGMAVPKTLTFRGAVAGTVGSRGIGLGLIVDGTTINYGFELAPRNGVFSWDLSRKGSVRGTRIQPFLTFASGLTTASPSITSFVEMSYDLETPRGAAGRYPKDRQPE